MDSGSYKGVIKREVVYKCTNRLFARVEAEDYWSFYLQGKAAQGINALPTSVATVGKAYIGMNKLPSV